MICVGSGCSTASATSSCTCCLRHDSASRALHTRYVLRAQRRLLPTTPTAPTHRLRVLRPSRVAAFPFTNHPPPSPSFSSFRNASTRLGRKGDKLLPQGKQRTHTTRHTQPSGKLVQLMQTSRPVHHRRCTAPHRLMATIYWPPLPF